MSERAGRASAELGSGSFIVSHAADASALGDRLAELVGEPPAFEEALRGGLRGLADPAYAALLEVASPKVTTEYAVRRPLLERIERPIRRALRDGSSAPALWLAQRLVDAEHRDLRLFALLPLRRALAPDPELSWQLLRRMAARAGDWIEVDALAGLWARGILAEPFRWAELEQLVYSRRVFERRLVGASLATIPHRTAAARRHELRGHASERAFDLIGQLMGDAQPMVQKSLAWAVREWSPIDAERATAFLRKEASRARADGDGARAWVVREALSRQPVDIADELRSSVTGVRRRPGMGSTSSAAATSARFAPLLHEDDEIMARQGDRYARSRV